MSHRIDPDGQTEKGDQQTAHFVEILPTGTLQREATGRELGQHVIVDPESEYDQRQDSPEPEKPAALFSQTFFKQHTYLKNCQYRLALLVFIRRNLRTAKLVKTSEIRMPPIISTPQIAAM